MVLLVWSAGLLCLLTLLHLVVLILSRMLDTKSDRLRQSSFYVFKSICDVVRVSNHKVNKPRVKPKNREREKMVKFKFKKGFSEKRKRKLSLFVPILHLSKPKTFRAYS